MKKKSLITICIALIVLSTLVAAQNKIKIDMVKENFAVGENIAFTVSLYDSGNNLIDENILVTVEDAGKKLQIEKTVPSNKLADINLGDEAKAGSWTITAKYNDVEEKEFFAIEEYQDAVFEIQGDKLLVRNIGNTRYVKTVDIKIGDSLGTKEIDLEIGEETSFRLVAPDGTYNIEVSVGGQIKAEKGNVALTGNVIGVLDERLASGSSPVTGGLKPGESEADESFYSNLKNKKFIYVFLLVVVGGAVLLAIEKKVRKKV